MEYGDLLTTTEVAAQLRVTVRSLQRWRTAGLGPWFVRLGPRKIAYAGAELRKWLDTRSHQSRAAERDR